MLSTVGLVRAGLDFKIAVEHGAPVGKVVDSTAIKKEIKVSLNL